MATEGVPLGQVSSVSDPHSARSALFFVYGAAATTPSRLDLFQPEQICILFFERLSANFTDHVQFARPCLEHFGRKLEITEGDHWSHDNIGAHKSCASCVDLPEEELLRIGAFLHKELYSQSTPLLRQILLTEYGREDVPRWEDAYPVAEGS